MLWINNKQIQILVPVSSLQQYAATHTAKAKYGRILHVHKMPKETTDSKVQIESSTTITEKLLCKQHVDISTDIKTKRNVVPDNIELTTNENDDIILSSVRVVMLGLLLLIIGAVGFYYLPGMISSNAKGSKVVNSIYCSAITLTTYVHPPYFISRGVPYIFKWKSTHRCTVEFRVYFLSTLLWRIGFVRLQLSSVKSFITLIGRLTTTCCWCKGWYMSR